MNPEGQDSFPLVPHDPRELVTRMDRSLDLVERILAETAAIQQPQNAGAEDLTTKLMRAAKDVIIVEHDCGTHGSVTIRPVHDADHEVVSLKPRILGRVSAQQVKDPETGALIVDANQIIDDKVSEDLARAAQRELQTRSVLTCESYLCSNRGCCALCYGLNPVTGKMAEVGDAVGIIAAESIRNAANQLSTVLVSSVGGHHTESSKDPRIVKAEHDGSVRYNNVRSVETIDGHWVVFNTTGTISVHDECGRELECHRLALGAEILVPGEPYDELLAPEIPRPDNCNVKAGETLVQWDADSIPVLSDRGGMVTFRDMVPGITVITEDDKEGKGSSRVVRHTEDLHPEILVLDPKTRGILGRFLIPTGAYLAVEDGRIINPGGVLASVPKRPKEGGLARVIELFEARGPDNPAHLAEIGGSVKIQGIEQGRQIITVVDWTGSWEEKHLIAPGKHVIVSPWDRIDRGSKLTEGAVDPHELLRIGGVLGLRDHFVNEIQEALSTRRFVLDDKHIELILAQMLGRGRVTEPHDSAFEKGQIVSGKELYWSAWNLLEHEGIPAEAEVVLLGISELTSVADFVTTR